MYRENTLTVVLVPFSKALKYIRSCWIHGSRVVKKAACKTTDHTALYWISLTMSSSSVCPSPVDRLFLDVSELIKLWRERSFSILKAPSKSTEQTPLQGGDSENRFQQIQSLYCYVNFEEEVLQNAVEIQTGKHVVQTNHSCGWSLVGSRGLNRLDLA